MAYVGIQGSKCSHCGSTATTEIQTPSGGDREVFLKCFACRKETSYGVYVYVHGSLIKKSDYDRLMRV
jgi:translation initiation factor 2 beta subunit (eIF-2beta)/eIF-5